MRKIGSYEAKTRLPELLKAVEQGETIVITRRGTPVARLVPVAAGREEVKEIIERIKRARETGPKVPLAEILAARHEGHRF